MVNSRPRAPWNRCAIYTRQSVTRPGGDETLTSCTLQREACERFAREQGWSVLPERFDDEGESGATMERPALERLVDAIRAEAVGRVVVYRLDRLTRRLADWALLQRVFEHHNVGLTVVHGSLDVSGGPMARFQLNMLATLAEFEREMIGERLRDARAARRAHGLRSAGRVPLGYIASSQTKQLAPVPEEAALVRWAFERAAEGALPATIADEANLRGGQRLRNLSTMSPVCGVNDVAGLYPRSNRGVGGQLELACEVRFWGHLSPGSGRLRRS